MRLSDYRESRRKVWEAAWKALSSVAGRVSPSAWVESHVESDVRACEAAGMAWDPEKTRGHAC